MAGKRTTLVGEDQPKVLVSRWADPWIVGGIGIAAWVLLRAQSWGGPEFAPVLSGPVYWVLLATSGTHFGASYHLAYGQGRHKVRERWPMLIAVPVALGVFSGLVVLANVFGASDSADEGVNLLLVSVFTLTGWHYIKQVYGVARVGGSLRGLKFEGRSVQILRYGLYPLWLLQAVKVWGGRGSIFDRFLVGYDVVPAALVRVIEIVTYLSVLVLAVTFVRLAMQWRQLPPATIWTPYAVGFLWFLFPPNYASASLVFGALHGMQYLACAHRAEIAWGVERAPGKAVWWWSSAFGGALATGMLLVYWLPRWLTNNAAATSFGTVSTALLFSFFNLHHYAVDASIWRFGGDHIRRITKGPIPAGADGPVPGAQPLTV